MSRKLDAPVRRERAKIDPPAAAESFPFRDPPPVPARPVTREAREMSPTSKRSGVEADWFASPAPRMLPVGHELETRRGWQPPPPSRGLAFAGVSFLLIGAAVAGSFFLFAPDHKTQSHTSEPASTTEVTGAQIPAQPAAAAPLDEPAPATAAPPSVPTASLTAEPPRLVAGLGSPPEATTVAKPKEPAPAAAAPTTTPAPVAAAAAAPAPKAVKPAAPKAAAPSKARDTNTERGSDLPDLDRAASAAGVTPSTPSAPATPSPAATLQKDPYGAPEPTQPTPRAQPAPAPSVGDPPTTPAQPVPSAPAQPKDDLPEL
jgi:hypothetical protein